MRLILVLIVVFTITSYASAVRLVLSMVHDVLWLVLLLAVPHGGELADLSRRQAARLLGMRLRLLGIVIILMIAPLRLRSIHHIELPTLPDEIAQAALALLVAVRLVAVGVVLTSLIVIVELRSSGGAHPASVAGS